MFKYKRVRNYGKKRYVTHTTRWGRYHSPYNSKIAQYNHSFMRFINRFY